MVRPVIVQNKRLAELFISLLLQPRWVSSRQNIVNTPSKLMKTLQINGCHVLLCIGGITMLGVPNYFPFLLCGLLSLLHVIGRNTITKNMYPLPDSSTHWLKEVSNNMYHLMISCIGRNTTTSNFVVVEIVHV